MSVKDPVIADVHSSDSLKIFTQKILIVLAFVGGIYMLSLLTSVLTIFFFSGFLTILFSPFLDRMNKKGIPSWLGIVFILLGILLFFFIVLFAIVPIFTQQLAMLFSYIGDSFDALDKLYRSGGVDALGFPSFLKSYIKTVDFGTLFELVRNHVSSLSSVVASLSKNLLQSSTSIISSISGGIFQAIMVGVFTFFMSLERRAIKEFLYSVLSGDIREYLVRREDAFLHILLSWMKGQTILGFSIFLLTLLGLFSLRLFGVNMDNVFTLALIAGLMEFIPYVGPFLALLPALAIAAGMGITPVVSIFILYILIQQAENNIFVPMVMGKTLDISPFLILFMMTVMASLLGIVGILLAIPFTAVLQIVVSDALRWRDGEMQYDGAETEQNEDGWSTKKILGLKKKKK